MSEPSSSSPESHSSLSWFWWNRLRPWIFVLVCVVTLIALFYAVENWRGKMAWEKTRRELEAKGDTLDWSAYIPPPIPDEQNIFKAPKMQEWFVRDTTGRYSALGSNGTNAPFTPSARRNTNNYLLAEVRVLPLNTTANPGETNAVLQFGAPETCMKAQQAIDDVLGPNVNGASGPTLTARPLEQIKPIRLEVQAAAALSVKDIEGIFLSNSIPPSLQISDRKYGNLKITQASSNTFSVWLWGTVYGAADYLEWTESLTNDLNVLREALKRPHARMDGDYQQAYLQPIANFVRLRTVAQLLGQRAQCYLLLDQPDQAWHELKLVRDMCRLLHTEPGGRTMTLLAAMIDTAITGLYVNIVSDGLRLHAWREPQLVALQQQLGEINLLPGFEQSFECEAAGTSHTLETMSSSKLRALFISGSRAPSLGERLEKPVELAPRGWIYQNMALIVSLHHQIREVVNVRQNIMLPQVPDMQWKQLNKTMNHFSPYTFLAAIAIPNFSKAAQTLAHNQTLANEALVVCGLERHRLKHGQYPETMEELVPQFIERLPHDIIGGQGLKYRATADDHFVLYSVGWNERDDGGVPGKTTTEGDWVWENQHH